MIPGAAAGDGNEVLAALPPREREALWRIGECVTLVPDLVLGRPGERIRQAWFPYDGLIALLADVDGHEALALDLVGSEGMLGAPLVLGVHTSPLRARVQVGGRALCVGTAAFERALAEAPVLERLLRRYLAGRLAQVARTAACASYHVVEARLACWMLMAHDRAHGDRLHLTHERIARLLGVRRSGVSTAAGVLQARQLIDYTRGRILILDRAGLERAACSCYRKGAVAVAVAPVIGIAPAARAPAAAPEPAQPRLLRVVPHRR